MQNARQPLPGPGSPHPRRSAMSGSHPKTQLLLARLREFYREPEVIFWVYGFPLILAVTLGIAFTRKEPQPPPVDVERTPGQSQVADLVSLLQSQGLPTEVHTA